MALSSIIASIILTVSKLIVGLATGSMGILSEAAHSLLDLFAAIMTYFAVNIGDKPADKDHPYGHGKVESVSALAETGLLFITSAWIIFEAIKRINNHNTEIEVTWYSFVVITFSIIIDYSRAKALNKVAKDTNSQALEADALHFSSDIWSSAVVLVGLLLAMVGFIGADAYAALGVAVFVIIAGYRLGKRTIDVLVDTAPEGIGDIVKSVLVNSGGVIGVNKIRVRPLGPNLFIDAEILINRNLSVTKSAEIVKLCQAEIIKKIPRSDVIIHTKVLQMDDESMLETVKIISAKHNILAYNINIDSLEKVKYISYNLALPNQLTVKQAHNISSRLEKEIKAEIDQKIVINTHIDPFENQELESKAVSLADARRIIKEISGVEKGLGLGGDIHDINVRNIENKLFITLHCNVSGNLKLEDAHSVASQLKDKIKLKIKDANQVVVHLEPK